MRTYSIEELQRIARTGDEDAIYELGRRAIDIDFCLDDGYYCKHALELWELEQALDAEIPPDCPHCGKLLTDV